MSAEVDTGETIAIVGPSGGGKSTLLRCLNYLEAFEAGEIDIAGFELRPGMDGSRHRETLRALRDAGRHGVPAVQPVPAPDRARQHHARAARRAARRSRREPRPPGSSCSRASASAIAAGRIRTSCPAASSSASRSRARSRRSPQVLLFDEPTSALDPEMRDEVMAVIRISRAGGMTMLVVTHEMQFATDIATRVWVIDKGTIAEDGPPAQVVDEPKTDVAREYFGRLRARRR